MNRRLHWFNFLGVLALAALSVVQWRANRQLNLDLNAVEKDRQQQATRLDELTRQLKGGATDLDEFRAQLTRATASLKDTKAKLALAERQLTQLTNERAQLKTSVTNWAAAVAARDVQLKQAGAEAQKQAEERTTLALKFNDLARRQNEQVKELERLMKERNDAVTALNQRTREFTVLVEKYNALAKPPP